MILLQLTQIYLSTETQIIWLFDSVTTLITRLSAVPESVTNVVKRFLQSPSPALRQLAIEITNIAAISNPALVLTPSLEVIFSLGSEGEDYRKYRHLQGRPLTPIPYQFPYSAYIRLPHYSATAHVTAYPNPDPIFQPSAVPTPRLHCKGYTFARDCRRIGRYSQTSVIRASIISGTRLSAVFEAKS